MEKRNRFVRYGFTMIELMAMLVIIGLLGTLVATRVLKQIDKAKVATTKANLKTLHAAVNNFYMDHGRFLSEEGGLEELIVQPGDIEDYPEGGYLEEAEVPKDGWKNEFEYVLYPESGKPFVIISYGADNAEGGVDDNTDLYSTDAQ